MRGSVKGRNYFQTIESEVNSFTLALNATAYVCLGSQNSSIPFLTPPPILIKNEKLVRFPWSGQG